MTTIISDILSITSGTIAHQVNCIGATGGLAGVLRRQYPRAFIDYSLFCSKYRERCAGMALLCSASESISILHIFGQIMPGPNTEMDLVRMGLKHAQPKKIHLPLYFPYKMGCGLGGGYWPDYLALLEECFPAGVIVQREGDA